MSFNYNKVEELYPGAGNLMQEAMLIWKLPSGKESMMSEVCENGQYFAQEKIDGALYQFVKGINGEKYLFGRTISTVTGLLTEKGANVPHIMSALDCFPNGTVLIGEIYYPGGTSKNVTSIMGCLAPEAIKRQEDKGKISYYVHDIIFYDGINLMNTGAWDRYRILQAVWQKLGLQVQDNLRLATSIEHGIEDEVSRILNSGGEGMVLKKRNAVYSPGKRPAWSAIKFKQMDDVDLVCTRTIPASRMYTGKELETWQYWEVAYPTTHGKWDGWDWREVVIGNYYEKYIKHTINELPINAMERRYQPVTKPYALGWHSAIGIGAYDDEGHLIELGTVSSGLTDEDKAAMGADPSAFVGKVVALHCMSIDRSEKTLRHPVFKSWRDDKNAADCTIKTVFG